MAPVKLSPSALSTWVDCRRKYRYTYLERQPRGRAMAHFSLGNSVHAVLRDFVAPIDEPDLIENLLEKHWQTAGYRDADMSEAIKSLALVWLTQYCENEGEISAVAVERTVSYTIGDVVLSGRIDRLDQRKIDGKRELVVVDYKTGSSAPTSQEAKSSLALAFYAVAAWRQYAQECVQVELHHLPTGTRAVARHTNESLARHRDRILSIVDEIVEARKARPDDETVFTPSPSRLCAYCDFRALCPEGEALTPAVEPWAAVEHLEAEALELGLHPR